MRNADAMAALLPRVNQSNDLYNATYEALCSVPDELEALKGMNRAIADIKAKAAEVTLEQSPSAVSITAIVPTHQATGTESLPYLMRLFHDASTVLPRLEAVVRRIASEVGCRVVSAPLKTLGRALAKTLEDYGGDFSQLKDLARVSMECSSARMMDGTLQKLNSSPDIELVNGKPRTSPEFDAAVIGGYRDVMLTARLASSGHLVEIQIHLDAFIKIKKERGHGEYKYSRALHSFDPDVIRHQGQLTTEVLDRAARGLVRFIDAAASPALQQDVCARIVPGLLANDRCLLLHLDLMGTQILSDAFCSSLASAGTGCKTLKTLIMVACGVDDPVIVAIAEVCGKGAMPQLQWLHLNKNEIGDAAMKALAEAAAGGAMTQLERLALEQNKIGDPSVTALAKACAGGALANLKELWLDNNQIGDAGCTALANAAGRGALVQLQLLNLGGNEIGDAGLTTFAQACAGGGAMAHLQELDLRSNQIGDAGMIKFSEACAGRALANCRQLDISFNKIGDAGMEAFASACGSGALPALKTLWIDRPSEELKAHCSSKNIKLNTI